MRLHHFFIEFFIEEKVGTVEEIKIYDPKLIHQWMNVFKMRVRERLVLLDNTGFEFECEISSLTTVEVVFTLIEKRASKNIPTKEIWLFQSLPKKDTFEWIAEKATELGVTHIVPVISERTEKKDFNAERVNKIIREAAEQSHRGTLPTLHPLKNFNTALSVVLNDRSQTALALDPLGTATIHESVKANRLAIFIGPEGGWSDAERAAFTAAHIKIVSLGNQVLRSETAVIAALSLAVFS